MTKKQIFVLNSSHPEVDRLAAEFSRRGTLIHYVRRYAMQERLWERILQKSPGLSKLFKASALRKLPPGLESNDVIEAGVLYDFIATSLPKLPLGRSLRPLGRKIMNYRDRSLAQVGARLGTGAPLVVSNYSIASDLFAGVKSRGGQTVLNYPIAHHNYSKRLLEEEAEREPAFADSLAIQIPPRSLAARLDYECSMADKILVGSTFAASTFIHEGIPSERIITIPYGADMSRFHAPVQEHRIDDTFRVLFVGQIGQRKGITYLFRAYEKFMGKNTELVLAGNFSGAPSAFSPYLRLFRHVGQVPHIELPRLYRSADVFVFPTLIEGMGHVFLEAMACGVPVIVSPNGPSDIVRDGVDGFIVPIRDPDAIAEKLEVLRANKELRAQMGRAAAQRAIEYTWERYVTDAANAIESLVR